MVTRVGVRAAVRAAVIAYGAAASLPALALGLGEIEMQSFLNEPLRAEVELLDTRELTVDDIRIRLAAGDDFDRLGVERSFFLTSIKFDIEVDEGSGRGVIRLSTDEAVLEPFIDLIIEARWPSGRLLREYTVLVDPPAFRQDVVTVSAVERIQQTTNLEKPALVEESRAQQPDRSASEPVALRKSSLPAGQMPERAFSAETADLPRSGNRYMVKRDETLWQIASEGKPQGLSVQQAMLEIQRLNPEAFINGNINQIKAGYIIYLPAAGEVSSDDLARALDEVREQNQEWRTARGAPGVSAAATLRVSADSSAASPASDRETDGSVDAPASQQGQAASVGSRDSSLMDAAAGDVADATPSGESSGSSELAAQLDAMATRLDTLEQIVSLKDEQIATLEQALREAREAAAVAAAVPAPAPVATVAPPAQQAPDAAATAPQTQTGGIPWLPISGGLLALVAAVVLFLRRRQKDEDDDLAGGKPQLSQEDDDVFAGVNLTTEAFDQEEAIEPGAEAESAAVSEPDEADEPEAARKTTTETLSRGGSRGYGERKHDDYIDEGAAGDALAEADIYIAYGRYLQAIELLETAISSDPGNGAYRVKLIELYVDMGEEASAVQQLEELREYGSTDSIARGEALLGAGAAAVSAPSFMADAPQESPAALDLNDDLDLESADLDADPEDTADTLELSLENAKAESPSMASAPALDEDIEPIEFAHLEIEEDSVSGGGVDELDFSSADEELDLSDALVSAEADNSAAGPGDGETEELLIAEDADQMATKLDLARAYIDMGDSDGARGILEEVIEKGTQEQQQESRDLLARIA